VIKVTTFFFYPLKLKFFYYLIGAKHKPKNQEKKKSSRNTRSDFVGVFIVAKNDLTRHKPTQTN